MDIEVTQNDQVAAAWKEKIKAIAQQMRQQKETRLPEQEQISQGSQDSQVAVPVPLETHEQILSKQFSNLPLAIQQQLKAALKF